MSKDHRLQPRKSKGVIPSKSIPLNFLLGCGENSLANFILARYSEAADVRRELLANIDRLIEQMMLARMGEWFKATDRNVIKQAIENPIDVMAWAAEKIRNQGRGEEEIGEDGYLIPLPSLPPGAAHLAAAVRYQERNMAEGKCSLCPEPLDRNSTRFCTKHLETSRNRMRQKKGLADVGSREYLYAGELPESTHGRQPGTLASLALNREKATRALLSELGVKPEHAAVSLNAAKEALLKVIPKAKAEAMTREELSAAAIVPSKQTGIKSLKQLMEAGQVHRVGKGVNGDPYRYFAVAPDSTDWAWDGGIG